MSNTSSRFSTLPNKLPGQLIIALNIIHNQSFQMGICINVHGLELYTESGIRMSDNSSLNFQLEIVYSRDRQTVTRHVVSKDGRLSVLTNKPL